MQWFTQLDYWHWLILAVVLMILEVFSPGAFLLWLGLAAGTVGLLLLLIPDITWQIQILLFALLSVTIIVLVRAFLQRRPIETDQPHLNRRGEQYLDRTFTLQEPIVNGEGKIHVDDTTWKITGEDCPAGTRIRISGVQGVVLQVSPVD
ncbi:MAG: NfeD family protein [Candidatus Thiodiazotropha endolucinida]|uniref:NfeD family protein n=1 Tax=Candidatus Thiodiazotropha sp. LNASS1 TaxID=3096260 RepID=UPI001DB445AD|nr:NfeD family protein [Candidatus Thiodiazotropha sp. (ex Lucina pensylvanica)]MBT3041782.1 NfeD family protein [Candidatus Thiodiazotropha sp. (ex Codakia orbicularis)]MBW9264302.1 NfeD family protein [Candidatus Thiodiazotropha sp. (ex. Lucinisca nassula)]MCG8049119.1 NfeD family protein [Candidatus Thiodiazotropha taylori]MCG8093397.1 NfeD family protein [Candidatus Thiodiazotropha endolucinida]MCU7943926.1 NfeD family protein [Candidatus Thiodiazotropha sp. (ex Cardiolucina cf. quadrata)]